MERTITTVKCQDFAKYCLSTLKPKPIEIKPPEPKPEPKEEIQGPERVIGTTNYKKWEEFKEAEESEEKKQAEEYIKSMCSQDHRKEIELYERPTKEKLIACSQFKTQGNDAYKQKNYSLAALFYRKGLLQLDYTFPEDAKDEQTFKDLEISLHLNMCIAKYYLEEYDECLSHVGQVLKHSPGNPKALYRKALVLYKRDLLNESREIMIKIVSENNKNQEAIELLMQIDKKLEDYKSKQKKVFKAMIDGQEVNK
ncbi:hypothetical protein SteCoe_17947 [Stentor coeruleus]|uniref:Uncharacterized protein n=1 Tax=Stentor coeruleus TaxID=5963 RepID=A0A1R2BXX3_9CILI|nr:hypothetical protein SteCoe_17947 [Stentor coeruleus]